MRYLKITQSITNRESASLDKYLYEISKVDLIASEEEVRLVQLIKKGNKDAFDRLIKANLRFVVSVAKQYQGQGLSLPDLINEGNIGLIKSVKGFDDTRGFKFISYAVWWIRQCIIHGLAEHSRMVRIPLNQVSLNSKIQKANAVLEQELERSPSAEELGEVLQMKTSEITSGMSNNDRHLSLDSPFSDNENNSLLDILENKNADKGSGQLYDSKSLKLEINRSLESLTEREKQTLCCFYGIGMDHPLSLADIGKKFDITAERVRQIKDKALNTLRRTKNANSLRTYL